MSRAGHEVDIILLEENFFIVFNRIENEYERNILLQYMVPWSIDKKTNQTNKQEKNIKRCVSYEGAVLL